MDVTEELEVQGIEAENIPLKRISQN